jgi:hypothetical protein
MRASWIELPLKVLFTIAFFSGQALAQRCPDPGPNQITVFRDHDFQGNCKTLGVGEFPNSAYLFPVSNDSISSLKVGSNVRAHLFKDRDFSGPVALYEAGSIHNVRFPDSSPLSLGPNVNDKTTSIIVQDASGVRIPYIFVNDYPSDRETVWSNDAQGLCHTNTDWFITNTTTLFKIPLHADLNRDDPSVAQANIPGDLQRQGYDHMGDPDCIIHDGEGFVFVPLESCNPQGSDPSNIICRARIGVAIQPDPKVAVFRASDLSFVNSDFLYVNADKHAGWLAIDPSNGIELWTSCGNLPEQDCQGQGLLTYTIDWSQVVPDGGFIFFAGAGPPPITLTNARNEPLTIAGMQGGVFDSTGDVLYFSNSDRCSNDGHGIHAFLKTTGAWIGQTANDYGPFRYTVSGLIFNRCGEKEEFEEEGLDFLPTTTEITPGITGQLHAILLNNDFFDSDNIYIKHYTQFQ